MWMAKCGTSACFVKAVIPWAQRNHVELLAVYKALKAWHGHDVPPWAVAAGFLGAVRLLLLSAGNNVEQTLKCLNKPCFPCNVSFFPRKTGRDVYPSLPLSFLPPALTPLSHCCGSLVSCTSVAFVPQEHTSHCWFVSNHCACSLE